MSVRKLFDKGIPESILSSTSLEELGKEVESSGNIRQTLIAKSRFIPQKNYANPKSFARFGSAEKYYEDSFIRILNQYPYDGSLRERQEFFNESNYLDLYVLDKIYPRTTGHAIFSPNGWGTQVSDVVGIGLSSEIEYIQVVGGPNSAPQEFLSDPLRDQFEYSNKYDVELNRESNLKFDFNEGITIETWLKKDSLISSADSTLEFIFHLTNDDTGTDTSGSIFIALDTLATLPSDAPLQLYFTSGTVNASVTFSDITNQELIDGQWHHIAVTAQNSGSDVVTEAYLDGNLKSTQISIGNAIEQVTGSLIANIGASRPYSYGVVSGLPEGSGKLSGSLDEFRYWKAKRTSEEIGRYWFTQYGGGTNRDVANTDLGVYLKFNEGITGDTSIDSTALDYSGRISNGSWVGYTQQARSTESAIDSYLGKESEFKDPIIYSEHPDYATARDAMISSGSAHDITNNTSLYNSIPSWIIEEDDNSGKELLKLTQIMSNYFDTLQLQMESYPNLKNINYPGQNTKPLPFAYKLLEGYGLASSEIFVDATILEQILNRNETEKFEEDLTEIKNLIYQNIYNNLTYIYKSKGSMKSFRNLMRCYGIDSELVKINLYADNATYKFEDNFQTRSTKKKYIDFNDGQRTTSTIYQHTASGNINSVSFISGSNSPVILNPPTTSPEYYTSLTLEAEAIFPKKLDSGHPNYFYTDFLTSSIAGFHTAIPEDPTDFSWISSGSTVQIHAVRDRIESEDVKFSLIYGIGNATSSLDTDLYYGIYDNTKWNFAARIRPERPSADLVTSAGITDYILEFYGVSTVAGQVENEFLLTSSISAVTGSRFLTDPKRVYAGAHLLNFTGSVLEETDIKLGSVRVWNSYLSDPEIKTHSRDPENYGVIGAYDSTYLYATSLTGTIVPKLETLSLSWAFDTLTGSNSSGEFTVEDFSSGSADIQNKYKWLGSIVGKQHTAIGSGFTADDRNIIDARFVYSGKQTIPENIQSSDMVFVDESDNTFKLSSRPQEYFFAIEKSMYQNISEEILNVFSTIVDFNTLIGDPVNRYRQEYKALGKLRELFFRKVQNTPDLDRYIEFYKWIDSSLTNFLLQFVPASAKFSDNMRTMVESHVLERNKYWNKFPTLDFDITDPEGGLRGINELNYDWEFGHAPVSLDENTNCYWWKNRAERTGVISSGDPDVDSNRQAYLDASLSVLNRKFTTPLNLTVENRTAIHGGSNFSQTKNTNYVKDVLKVGSTNGVFVTSDNIEPYRCNDQAGETKRKLRYRTFTNINFTNPKDETYVKGDKHLPFTMYSSSNPQGFDQEISLELGHNVQITNLHDDNYGSNYGTTLQGPFTDKFVGGLQRRHIDLNRGTADENSRPEGFKITKQTGRIKIARIGASRPRAIFYREELAKRPVNIRNIKIVEEEEPTYTSQIITEIQNFNSTPFSSLPSGWTTYGDVDWQVTGSDFYDGDRSVGSNPAIGDSQTTSLVYTASLPSAGELSFWWKVSSEASYDFLRFYINEVLQTSISGDPIPWSQLSYSLPAGDSNLRWEYSKDGSVTVGSDAGWVDDVRISYTGSVVIDPPAVTRFVSGTLVSNIGNYKRDHEIVQAPSRYVNNRAWINLGGWTLDNYPIESHLTSSQADLEALMGPKIQRGRNEHIFVSRFSAPGGKETMGDSNGGLGLDRYSAELSRYNSINIRNNVVRQPLNRVTLTNHISSYNSSSFYNINKNPRFYMDEISPGTFVTSSKFDNYWVQHPIPATDLAYSWITSSYSKVNPSGFGYWYNSQFWGGTPPVEFYVSGADSYSSIPVDFAGMNNLVYEPVLAKYTKYYDPTVFPLIGQVPKNLPNGCYPTAATPPPQVSKSECYEREADNFDFNTITSYRNSSLASVPTVDLFNVLTNKRNNGKKYSSWRQIRAHETNNARFLKRNNLYQFPFSEDFAYEPPVDIQTVGVGWIFDSETKEVCGEGENSTSAFTQIESSFIEVNYFSSQYLNQSVYGSQQPKILTPEDQTPTKGGTPFSPGCARNDTPYGIITDLYLNGAEGSQDSPVKSFVEMTYGARVYPTKSNLTRKIVRSRPGYAQYFWRDQRSARTILGSYKFNSNSQGYDIPQSSWALDAVENFVTAPIYDASTASTGAAGELQNDYSQCFSSSLFTNGFALSCSVTNYEGYPTCSSGAGSIPSASCLLQYGMVVVKSGSSFNATLPGQRDLIKQSRYFSEYAIGGLLAYKQMADRGLTTWIQGRKFESYPYPFVDPEDPTTVLTFLGDANTYYSPAETNKEFTISCWVKPQTLVGDLPQGRDTIISFEDFHFGKGSSITSGSVKMWLESSGLGQAVGVEVLVHTGSGVNDYYVDSGSTSAICDYDSWSNITFCYQTPAFPSSENNQLDRIKIYINGEYAPLNPATTGSENILGDNTLDSYIAASTCSVGHDATFYKTNTVLTSSEFASNVFNGLIDEMSIYNYSLHSYYPAAISALYNDGSPKDISNIPQFKLFPKLRPIAWWRFGDADADQEGVSSYELSPTYCNGKDYGRGITTFSGSAITTNANQQYFGASPYNLYKYCMGDGFPVVDYVNSYLSQSIGSRATYFMDYAPAGHSSSYIQNKEDIVAAPLYSRKHCMPSVFSVTHYGWSPPTLSPVSRSLKMPIDEIEAAADEWATKWQTPIINQDYVRAYPLGSIQTCGGSALWETPRLAGIVKDGQFISQSINPFSDTYEKHIEQLNKFNKDYTIVPEFRISPQIQKYFSNGGINVVAENNSQFEIVGMSGSSIPSDSSEEGFYKIYSNSDFLEHFEMVKEDHKNFADPSTISLKCDAIMKFVPYDGFYPSERALEIASQFSKSYGSHVSYNGADSVYTNARMRPFLSPFFRPGLMFNAIKSGIAVDYPIYTGSYDVVNYISYHSASTDFTSSYYALGRQTGLTVIDTGSAGWDYRIPFEALVNPENYITNKTIYDLEPCPDSALDIQAKWNGEGDILYSRMMSNYLAAIPEFFLPSGEFTTLSTAPESKFATVVSGTTYAMRVKLRKTMNQERIWRTVTNDESAITYEIPQDPRILNGSTEGLQETFTLYSRPSAFGPPVAATKGFGFGAGLIAPSATNAAYNTELYPSDSTMGLNPSFTPPYYNGESWADIIYTPVESGRVTIDEIMANSKVNYWRIDSRPNIDGTTGSVGSIIGTTIRQAIWSGGTTTTNDNTPMGSRFANAYSMQLDASLNLFGKEGDKWIISPKFETPHYNFNNNSIRPIDSGSGTLTIPTNGSESVPRGIWHQFGTMESDKGVYLEVESIPESWIERRGKYSEGSNYIEYGGKVDLSLYNVDKIESLSDLVGFENSKKLGNTAESLTVSEAIVAVPFVEENGERKFFEIPREVIQNALGYASEDASVAPISRAANAAAAVSEGLSQVMDDILDSEEQKASAKTQAIAIAAGNAASDAITQEQNINKPTNTIIDMVKKMKKYVFPPNMDFTKKNSSITPFAMYIFEFEYTFDQNDLAYMWQNIQPPMKNSQLVKKEVKLSHKLLANELMGNFGNGEYEPMKDRVQWMVFKVKQRANNNYYSKTYNKETAKIAQQHEYSYNWPYDFFSLVEFAKISTKVGFGATIQDDTEVQEVANTNTNPGLLRQPIGDK